MNRITPTVKNLLIINIAVFVVLQWILKMPLPEMFGFRYILSDAFKPYQFLTYMFIHANGMHLFSNMFALFVFGPLLEMTLGPRKFLILYMVTGLGAGLLYEVVTMVELETLRSAVNAFLAAPSPDALVEFVAKFNTPLSAQGYTFVHKLYASEPNNPMYIEEARLLVQKTYEFASNGWLVGASGAVFGILMAFGMLFPNLELMLLFPPMPIKAKYLVFLYGAYELYSLYVNRPDDNVAHFAHIGGMVFAFFLVRVWAKRL